MSEKRSEVTKIFPKQRALFLSVASAACLFVMGCSVSQQPSGSEKQWETPGNFIVSYGPVMEPYSSKIDNSYYLYSSSGQHLGRSSGRGSWAPVALTSQEGAYGYFSDSIEKLGVNDQKVSFLKNSPVSFYGRSPEGKLAVAIINDSHSAEFHHSSIAFGGGSIVKQTLPTVPHSLAVGEEAALVVGDSRDGNHRKKDLVLIRNDGAVKAIDFPPGYNAGIPDFKYPHVNYLGSGLFEVLEGVTEGEVTHFRSFEVRIGVDDRLMTQRIAHFSMALHDDFAITRTLPFGENGFIDAKGNVFINHRDLYPPESTGKIQAFDANDFIPVNSSKEALIGIRREDSIEIRRWGKPEEIVVSLAYEGEECSDEACGISSISLI